MNVENVADINYVDSEYIVNVSENGCPKCKSTRYLEMDLSREVDDITSGHKLIGYDFHDTEYDIRCRNCGYKEYGFVEDTGGYSILDEYRKDENDYLADDLYEQIENKIYRGIEPFVESICCDMCDSVHLHIDCPVCEKEKAATDSYEYPHDIEKITCKNCNITFDVVDKYDYNKIDIKVRSDNFD